MLDSSYVHCSMEGTLKLCLSQQQNNNKQLIYFSKMLSVANFIWKVCTKDMVHTAGPSWQAGAGFRGLGSWV